MMTLTTCKTPPLACVFKLTLAEELDEAALAVGFVVLLFECALVQLFKAEGADEMLGVELLAHGSDAAAGDGLLTAGAEGAAVLVVMSLTVGLPFMLEETAVHKRNETLLRENTGVSQLRTNDANNATIKPHSSVHAAETSEIEKCEHPKHATNTTRFTKPIPISRKQHG